MNSYDPSRPAPTADRRPHQLRLRIVLTALSFSMAACREVVVAAKSALLDYRSTLLHGGEAWKAFTSLGE